MILRDILDYDTPCEDGLKFIAARGILDWDLAECWDLIKAEAPDFLGFAVKHAPMSADKIKALRLVRECGVFREDGSIDQEKNHDPAISEKCFGWMDNPFRSKQ